MFNNFFDVAIAILLITTTLWGFMIGFITSAIFLSIVFFGGIFFTPIIKEISLFFTSLDFDILFQIPSSVVAELSSFFTSLDFGVLFKVIVALIIIFFIIKTCQILFKVFFISIFNKVAGGLVGFLAGVVLSSFLIKYLKQIYLFQDEIANSTFVPYIYQASKFFSL